MSVTVAETHFKDPLFQSSMGHLQKGEWREGLAELNTLIENYPLAHDLRSLRQEMQLRARIDIDEQKDQNRDRRVRIVRGTIRIGVLAVVALVTFWVVLSYSSFLQQQWTNTTQRLEGEVQVVELAVKFRSGQNMLVANRADEALALFQEVAAVDPSYPDLQANIQQAESLLTIEGLYEQAMRLINLNDIAGALMVLSEIESKDPNYKDVSLRINEINNQFFLTDLLTQAQQAYQAEDWIKAVSGFETVRAINPQYQETTIEEQLFNSYMNAAIITLRDQTDSFDALEVAEGYYRKALALRPGDATIRLERDKSRQLFRESLSKKYMEMASQSLGGATDSIEKLKSADEFYQKALALTPDNPEVLNAQEMAHRYIQSQTEFADGRYTAVIEQLEFVFQADPEYALGTSRQTLYEAYMARGSTETASGEYQLALEDYKRAAVIAEQSGDTSMIHFAAKIKVAEVTGVLGDYENAVFVYQDALDVIDLSTLNSSDFPKIVSRLEEADRLANLRYYRQAFKIFRETAPKVLTSQSRITYVVQSDDYLVSLANRYNTTVEAIIEANKLISPKQIQAGQTLIIPGRNP